MRISDCSADVCSSDLTCLHGVSTSLDTNGDFSRRCPRMSIARPSKRALPRAGRIPRFAGMTDSTVKTPNDPAGPWAIPVRRPLPGDAKRKSTNSFPRKVWDLPVGIKDALAPLFLLLFFVALFGLLAGRPNAGVPAHTGAAVQ